VETAGGAVDDRLLATQQNFKAVLFDRGMETANDRDFCISQGLSEVVGFEDEVTRALDGAEEGDYLRYGRADRRFLQDQSPGG
jgi:hypothetical protein